MTMSLGTKNADSVISRFVTQYQIRSIIDKLIFAYRTVFKTQKCQNQRHFELLSH